MLDALAEYRILERIDVRPMGEIFRALDTRHGRTVAIHVVSASIAADPIRREHFLADARAAAALSHPNIAAVFDVADTAAQLFLACEFVQGEPLTAVMGGRPMNPRRALDLGIQVADALAAVHAAGMVLGDLAPSTIIVTPRGTAKLVDVGLTRWLSDATTLNANPQTPNPETPNPETPNPTSDLFSLGVVLFEMFTGRLPFSRESTPRLPGVSPRPTSINAAVPREVDGVMAKMLAANPDDRYDSAAIVAVKLRAIAGILESRRAASERAR